MRFKNGVLIVLAALGFALPVQADDKITVLELFTTQGCVNCPPADAVFKTVIEEYEGEMIALGCHVTYFDRAELRDALSETFCDARHGKYLKAHAIERIYTPQMVINGKYDVIGNNQALVNAGLKMAASESEIRPVALAFSDGKLDITLPDIILEKPATVWLYVYDHMHTVEIIAGQNTDSAIDYANAVRHLVKLMAWDGRAQDMRYDLQETPGYGYAVIAEYDDNSKILAAGKIEKDKN